MHLAHHAIRPADSDGNSATMADPEWSALILAPRFQEYVSTHASIKAAFMRVLSRELGDHHIFTLSSPNYPRFAWTFDRFSDAAAQVLESGKNLRGANLTPR